MRKLSKSRHARAAAAAPDVEDRSGRISGATITSWPGAASLDYSALFSPHKSHATVTGTMADPVAAARPVIQESVSLSDGTRITFASSNDMALEDEV